MSQKKNDDPITPKSEPTEPRLMMGLRDRARSPVSYRKAGGDRARPVQRPPRPWNT